MTFLVDLMNKPCESCKITLKLLAMLCLIYLQAEQVNMAPVMYSGKGRYFLGKLLIF